MSNWELISTTEGKLTCEIEAEAWKKAQEKAFNKICKNAEVKGFRKGQAPKAMVKKMINPQSVLYDAMDLVAYDAYLKGCEEKELITFGRPAIENMPVLTEDACTIEFKVNVEPEASLKDLGEVVYHVDEKEVTEEDITAELETLQQRYSDEVESDQPAALGDVVNINYAGSKDGELFDGGSAENYDLKLGSNSFIPGFEDGLVGVSKGGEKDLELTFPEDYHAEELKGANVVFHVTVNEVKKVVLPEINDDFAKDVMGNDEATLDSLKEKIKTDMVNTRHNQALATAENEMLEKFIEAIEVEVPEQLIKDESTQIAQQYAQQLAAQGLSLDMFLKYTNNSVESFVESFAEEAKKRCLVTFGLRAYAKANDLNVSEDEINSEIEGYANSKNISVDKAKEELSVVLVKDSLTSRKALEALKQNCTK